MKTKKKSLALLSLISSVVLLASCSNQMHQDKMSTKSSKKDTVTMTYDKLRSEQNLMGTLWEQKAAAKPVAGAKEFLQYANDNGVKIYYISDRADNQVDATIKNLEEQGIPVQGRDHLMFYEKGMTSKESRRQKVQETTNLVMLFGDNLVDFADFSKTSETERTQKLEELQKEFGDKFIIFPNPMYGSWESAIYGGKKLDAKQKVEEREKALKGFKK